MGSNMAMGGKVEASLKMFFLGVFTELILELCRDRNGWMNEGRNKPRNG